MEAPMFALQVRRRRDHRCRRPNPWDGVVEASTKWHMRLALLEALDECCPEVLLEGHSQ